MGNVGAGVGLGVAWRALRVTVTGVWFAPVASDLHAARIGALSTSLRACGHLAWTSLSLDACGGLAGGTLSARGDASLVAAYNNREPWLSVLAGVDLWWSPRPWIALGPGVDVGALALRPYVTVDNLGVVHDPSRVYADLRFTIELRL